MKRADLQPRIRGGHVVFAATLVAAIAGSACRPRDLEGAAGATAAAAEGGSTTPADKIAPYEPAPAAPSDLANLGRVLFFDTRLSGDGLMSCATCHDPAKGFGDGLPTGRGHDGKTLARNTPSVVNVDARAPFFWDGRARTAEEQALGPMANPDEMDKDLTVLPSELAEVPEYVARFRRAFGDDAITLERVGTAIAAFERTLVSAGAPIDRYLRGDRTALSPEAARGLELFRGKAECAKCHDGPHFTDASFHNIGVRSPDVGRQKVVDIPSMKGAFKTPGLRDVALTAPYFHDGSAATLMDVVEHYNRGGDSKDNLDGDIHPLGLSPADERALVAVMNAMTGSPIAEAAPRIPRLVTTPKAKSTAQLMKETDGMLDRLDKLIASLDEENWDAVTASTDTLIGNAEELAALRIKKTPAPRRYEFKRLLGNLVLDLHGVEAAVAKKDRASAMSIYKQLRDDCEACHDAFRWTKK